MKDIKFEFYRLKVIYPSNKELDNLNKKYDNGKNFTIEELVTFWRPTHDKEVLNFAGQNGWQIKTVINKETKDVETDIYYLQRDNSYSNFGKMTFREEYNKSNLYKEQERRMIKMTKRNK